MSDIAWLRALDGAMVIPAWLRRASASAPEATINAFHVEGRDLHFSPLPFSGEAPGSYRTRPGSLPNPMPTRFPSFVGIEQQSVDVARVRPMRTTSRSK